MAIKVYEPADEPGEPAPQHEFAVIFLRDGVRERHEFLAEPRFDWQNLRGLMHMMDSRRGEGISMQALTQIDRLIRRSLVNTDGVPERWVPKVVSEPGKEPWFTDPQGDHCTADMLPLYEAFDQGSSRRRWMHLMDHDDDVTVKAEQIVDLMQDLMEVAARRPTKSSAASSG
jgi:hypothetical protein